MCKSAILSSNLRTGCAKLLYCMHFCWQMWRQYCTLARRRRPSATGEAGLGPGLSLASAVLRACPGEAQFFFFRRARESSKKQENMGLGGARWPNCDTVVRFGPPSTILELPYRTWQTWVCQSAVLSSLLGANATTVLHFGRPKFAKRERVTPK